MNKILVIGFMLFALFFGAGNLIFPLKLGFDSGDSFGFAIVGFLITGVGLPLIGLIAGAFSKGGIPEELERKIHPYFSVLFMIAIYLTIGPLFAIPRTATTSYEIGFAPFITDSALSLFIFSIIFFIVVLYCSMSTTRMVDIIGKVLTPCLLLSIALLCIFAFLNLHEQVHTVRIGAEGAGAIGVGFTEGYLTMDALASIAFGIIAITAIKSSGINVDNKKSLLLNCFYAALISAIGLVLVYFSLAWVGNHFPVSDETLNMLIEKDKHLGAYLLVQSSAHLFGKAGPLLVSIIVILACLTTAIGLIAAVSGYFYAKFPRVQYKYYVYLFTLFSFILSNQGLAQVIRLSIPVLLILYPLAIVIIFLTIIDKIITLPNITYQSTAILTLILSLILHFYPTSFVQYLPLYSASLGWLFPAVGMLILSYIFGKLLKTKIIKI